jgi:uncharacterized protein (DUF2236 family)
MDGETFSDLAGYYGPGSISWRVVREAALLFGGNCAVLMQLAHPLVAAGVNEYSAYRSDPYGRFMRTLTLTQTIVFGTKTEARQAAQTINQRHQKVRGTLDTAAGSYADNTPYQARDPDLLLWVHATLIDTILRLYPMLIAPLAPAEQEQYYLESLQAVRLLGLPREHCPPTLAAFNDYMRMMLESDRLAVTPAAKELAALVLHPPAPAVVWPFFEATANITIGLLPPRLRAMYGYRWGRGQQMLFDLWVRQTRRMLRYLPPWLREFPAARAAEQRVLRALRAERIEPRAAALVPYRSTEA